jgi:hypothetical protein
MVSFAKNVQMRHLLNKILTCSGGLYLLPELNQKKMDLGYLTEVL